ncbi:unannotated protein [freshwater metagenome]|uniref:Unannotated protein n=1 Tax=freshwater metagenome TaxID=449393 RepID=A0A6J7T0G2_9ZZZZ
MVLGESQAFIELNCRVVIAIYLEQHKGISTLVRTVYRAFTEGPGDALPSKIGIDSYRSQRAPTLRKSYAGNTYYLF